MLLALDAPNRPCTVRVLRNALADQAGEPTASSNRLRLLWDQEPPQPVIRIAGKYASTSQPRVPVLIDFGERVLQSNPLGLFNTSGMGRQDVIYDVVRGRVYLIASAPNPNVTAAMTGAWGAGLQGGLGEAACSAAQAPP